MLEVHTAGSWLVLGKFLARSWQNLGNILARSRQNFASAGEEKLWRPDKLQEAERKPKDDKKHQKGAHRRPKGAKREAKRSQKELKGRPKGAQRETKLAKKTIKNRSSFLEGKKGATTI